MNHAVKEADKNARKEERIIMAKNLLDVLDVETIQACAPDSQANVASCKSYAAMRYVA
jgi:hypothetical protein